MGQQVPVEAVPDSLRKPGQHAHVDAMCESTAEPLEDHAASALPLDRCDVGGPLLGVAIESGRNTARVSAPRDTFEMVRKTPGILERLVRSLRDDGDHRVSGIPTEGDRPPVIPQ